MAKDAWDRAFYSGVAMTAEDIRSVLQDGVDVVQVAVQGMVSANAKHPTGLLEGSITAYINPKVKSGQAVMGWDETPLPDYHGRRGYVDGKGAAREVDSVDDYARILEYSEKRQLRHMEVGYDAVSDIAEQRMEEKADALLARMARDAGL